MFLRRITGTRRAGRTPSLRPLGEALEPRRLLSLTPVDGEFGASGTSLSVSGTVYHDAAGNGQRDAGDAPLAGVRVYIETNDNGRLDPGEIWTTTDAAGAYRLDNLADKLHAVHVETAADEVQTTPAEDHPHTVGFAAGPAVTGRDFGVRTVGPGFRFHGRLFADLDADGTFDANETGMGGATVYVDANHDGRLQAGEPSAVTGPDGSYVVTPLVPANEPWLVMLRLTVPDGYAATTPRVYYYGHNAAGTPGTPKPPQWRNFGLARPGTPGTVAARHVFYNRSAYDGNRDAAEAADDAAVAPGKTALLPGQAASAANVTSYSKGVNGVMIDIADLPADRTVSAADFMFSAGNSADGWRPGPRPASVAVRRGGGVNGSDRVTLTWAEADAVRNGWLFVTVLATPATGLTVRDDFYFGNLVGDADGSRSVNLGDFGAVRQAFGRTGLSVADGRSDFNRDGAVNLADFGLLRGNFGKSLPPASAAAQSVLSAAAPAAPGQSDRRRTRAAAARPAVDLASRE